MGFGERFGVEDGLFNRVWTNDGNPLVRTLDHLLQLGAQDVRGGTSSMYLRDPDAALL